MMDSSYLVDALDRASSAFSDIHPLFLDSKTELVRTLFIHILHDHRSADSTPTPSSSSASVITFLSSFNILQHAYAAIPLMFISTSPSPGSSDLHDTASSTAASVASLERVGVTALAQVVGARVDNDRSANDGLGADEGDVLVCRISSLSEGIPLCS